MMAAGVLAGSSAYADSCSEIEAQDLNSRIEAALLLAETTDSLDPAGQDKIKALRADLSKASDAQMRAQESDDTAKMDEVCVTYEDILKEAESLSQ
ncbi:MAG: hypothetical protein GWN87_12235 [Desulfuromonadales bacterium]|nr:hypothetical protein [Desulfuromonadales bacterium]NIS41192.1 hypothetical protein [Desulfuromonadales bacterium]